MQLFATASLLALVALVSSSNLTNLFKVGGASSLGFLAEVAGFDIVQHFVRYFEQSSFSRTIFVATLNTLTTAFLSIFIGSVLGFAVGATWLSSNNQIKKLASLVIGAARNVPFFLQLFFWYFVVLRNLPSASQSFSLADKVFLNLSGIYLPEPLFGPGFAAILSMMSVGFLTLFLLSRHDKAHKRTSAKERALIALVLLAVIPGLSIYFIGAPLSWNAPVLKDYTISGGVVLIPELVVLLAALSVYTAAFIADLIRSRVEAARKGQAEASLAKGIFKTPNLGQLAAPEAKRIIIPRLAKHFSSHAKKSSLAAAITYPDLMKVVSGTVPMQTGLLVEAVALTLAVYLMISLSFSLLMNCFIHSTRIIES